MVQAAPAGVPYKQSGMAVSLDKRTGKDGPARSALGSEVSADQPFHHCVVRGAVVGVATDGGIEKEPTEMPGAVCVME